MSTEESHRNKGKLLSTIGTNFVAIYITIAFAIATPYFNWQYAKQNGFFQWLMFGEIVPTGKALLWPYFIYADNASARRDAEDQKKMEAYLQNVDELMKERQALDYENVKETGRIEELMKTDRKAAMSAAASLYANLADKSTELLAKAEKITPPTDLRELQNINVSGMKGEIPIMRDGASALRSGNEGAFKDVLKRLADYDADWNRRRDAETAKLKGNSQ